MSATNSNRMHVHYAELDDVLYVAVDEPVPAVCDEDEDGILWRISYADEQLCGATVLDFRARGDADEVLGKIAERLSFDPDALRQAALMH